MRENELEAYRKLAQSKQKWELVAQLMSDMLESLGVDTADIMAADKEEAANMLLNRDEYIRRANRFHETPTFTLKDIFDLKENYEQAK